MRITTITVTPSPALPERQLLRGDRHARALHYSLWLALHAAQELELEGLQARLVTELATVTNWMAARDRR